MSVMCFTVDIDYFKVRKGRNKKAVIGSDYVMSVLSGVGFCGLTDTQE